MTNTTALRIAVHNAVDNPNIPLETIRTLRSLAVKDSSTWDLIDICDDLIEMLLEDDSTNI